MISSIRRFRARKRGLFVIVSTLSVAALGAAIFLALYAGRVYIIKNAGIALKPSQDFEIHAVTYYLQNDPAWSGDRIGSSGGTLGGKGCLISCVASAITDLGVPVTPKQLNAALTDVGGFEGSNLIWYKINEAFDGVDYSYARIFSSVTIESDLKAGLLPIINVRYHGTGVTHWLLVVGAKGGEFLVYDPLNADKTPIPLSTHGKVYAYRVLVSSNGQ